MDVTALPLLLFIINIMAVVAGSNVMVMMVMKSFCATLVSCTAYSSRIDEFRYSPETRNGAG